MSDIWRILNTHKISTPYPVDSYYVTKLRAYARRNHMRVEKVPNKARWDVTLVFINNGPYDEAQRRVREAREYMESLGLRRV